MHIINVRETGRYLLNLVECIAANGKIAALHFEVIEKASLKCLAIYDDPKEAEAALHYFESVAHHHCEDAI
jgi:hypothetical protein